MYTVKRGWIDTAGRCRTWLLLSPTGEELAELTRKRKADRLAQLLNSI